MGSADAAVHNAEVERELVHFRAEVLPSAARALEAAVDVDVGGPDGPRARGLGMHPWGLSSFMHSHGVNVRYVGPLASLLSPPHLRRLLRNEAAVRAVACEVRRRQRSAPSRAASDAAEAERSFLCEALRGVALALSDSPAATDWWQKVIAPLILQKFGMDLHADDLASIRSGLWVGLTASLTPTADSESGGVCACAYAWCPALHLLHRLHITHRGRPMSELCAGASCHGDGGERESDVHVHPGPSDCAYACEGLRRCVADLRALALEGSPELTPALVAVSDPFAARVQITCAEIPAFAPLPETERQLLEELALREGAVGPSHPRLLSPLVGLLSLYQSLFHLHDQDPAAVQAKIAPVVERIWAVAASEGPAGDSGPTPSPSPSPSHPLESRAWQLQALGELGRVFLMHDSPYRAEGCFKHAMARCVDWREGSSAVFASLCANAAELYRTQGRVDEAEPFAVHALRLFSWLSPARRGPGFIALFNNLALIAKAKRVYVEAEAWLAQALSLHRQLAGGAEEEDATLSVLLGNLAETYRAQGRPAEAEGLLRKCLEIDSRALILPHPTSATHLHNLSVCLLALGRPSEAKELAERAIEMNESARGRPGVALSCQLAAMYATSGRILWELGDAYVAQAEQHFSRALVQFVEYSSAVPIAHPYFLSALYHYYRMQATRLRSDQEFPAPRHQHFADQLSQMASLGCADAEMNVSALAACGGSVAGAVQLLTIFLQLDNLFRVADVLG